MQFYSLGSSKMVVPVPSSRWLAKGDRILSTLHPNTTLKPNPDPTTHPNPQPSPNPTPTPTPSPSPKPEPPPPPGSRGNNAKMEKSTCGCIVLCRTFCGRQNVYDIHLVSCCAFACHLAQPKLLLYPFLGGALSAVCAQCNYLGIWPY